jgi:lactoylglutathione lyase family protein
MTPTPRTFSHIGISVPDLDAAVKFYSEVMGFYVIMRPSEVTEDDSAIGVMCTDVFGPGWDRLRIAHLSAADGIGFELFEFKGNEEPDDNFAYRRHGTFHFAVQDPNLEDLLEKILAAGGKQRMPVREYFPDEKPFRMVYVEDPFGVIFEIYSHSYELTYSAGAYS